MRTSVSAEAFGTHNQKKEYKPIVIDKPKEVKEEIIKWLKMSFMFGSLSEKELNIVADAMTIVKPAKGATII